ncbi:MULTISPECIES: GNAT family N-acetyltransferase [unclassified Pseudonocardia]|uniref:GNAT family N-acetyltransferase n=1 Tax=unclassified Pseudonocardia TaxID=2619320 RepID=UPI001CF676AF|nr:MULTISPECIES: GNAT family N-acetyltransferase [unclassified Pseudonocardia]
MADVEVLVDLVDRRAAFNVFLGALHKAPVGIEEWREGWVGDDLFDDECWLGVRGANGEIVGTAHSFPTQWTLPGGARVSASAVTGVGVRADSTRKGRLSALMGTQLGQARERGDVAAVLHATQTGIYGRYGYGVVSRSETVRVPVRAEWRPECGPDTATGRRVRMLDRAEAAAVLPVLQERLAGGRPGGLTRPPQWWRHALEPASGATPGFAGSGYQGIAVHSGTAGDDGFVVWVSGKVGPDRDWPAEVGVQQLWASSAAATAGLWRFVTGLDLVDSVVGWGRPLDEDLDLMLADSRQRQVLGRGDELWACLVDISAALSARSWGSGDPVVLRVRESGPLALGDGAGTWRIGVSGVEPAKGVLPDLECSASTLMPAFLGDRMPSRLCTAGLWVEHTPGAAARADVLFAVAAPAPWAGTWF